MMLLVLVPNATTAGSKPTKSRRCMKNFCEHNGCALDEVAGVLFIDVVDNGETTGAPPTPSLYLLRSPSHLPETGIFTDETPIIRT
jgi:hypothetical protein